MWSDIEKLQQSFSDMQDVLRTTIRDELDEREVGGPGFVQSRSILDKLDQLIDITNNSNCTIKNSSTCQELGNDNGDQD